MRFDKYQNANDRSSSLKDYLSKRITLIAGLPNAFGIANNKSSSDIFLGRARSYLVFDPLLKNL